VEIITKIIGGSSLPSRGQEIIVKPFPAHEVVIARTQGVGKLSPELAINAGISGPMLRACGVDYDVRKVDGYGFYSRFKFRVPLGKHGDTYDRLMIRVLEMRDSLSILKQAFENRFRWVQS